MTFVVGPVIIVVNTNNMMLKSVGNKCNSKAEPRCLGHIIRRASVNLNSPVIARKVSQMEDTI
jgi:hypothetical protein